MNIKKEYQKFIDKYPSFIKQIISYEEGEADSIKFILKDNKIAWYYPLVANSSDKIIAKKKSKQNGIKNK